MRVTYNIQNRQYLRNTHNSLKNQLDSMEKIMTQKRYNRVSQDPSNASKAMTTRRQMWNIEMYNNNLATAKEVFSAAETALMTISTMYHGNVKTKLVQQANLGTLSDTDRQVISQELRMMAEHVIDTMNADFAERQIFGGTSANPTPYVVHDSVIISMNIDSMSFDNIERLANMLADFNGDTLLELDADFLGDRDAYDAYIRSYVSNSFDTLRLLADTTRPTRPVRADGETDAAFDLRLQAYGNDLLDYIGSINYTNGAPPVTSADLSNPLSLSARISQITALEVFAGNIEGLITDDDGDFTLFDSTNRGNFNGAPVVTYNGVPVDLHMHQGVAGAKDAAGNFIFGTDNYSITYMRDGREVDKNGRALSPPTPQSIPIDFDTAREKRDNSFIFPASNPIFVDIGMGIRYVAGTDQFGNVINVVDPQTAMDISLNGAKMLGSGILGGNSHNFAQALFDGAFAAQNDLHFEIVAAIDALDNAYSNVLQSITTLGARQISIEFYQDKNEDYIFNLKARQNDVEGVDIYDEITYLNALEAAFQAALQLSSRVLPRSVFDFMR